MKLISMRVENVKGCELAEMELSGRAVTIVGGNNHQGKSSFLDALAMAMGGKRLFPADPIKEGEEEAQIIVKMRPEDDSDALLPWPCTVTRTLSRSSDGTSYTTKLEIESEDNVPAPSPQTLLNELINGGFAFDPLAFVREKPQAQVDMLRDLVGLDTSKLDADREKLYARRTTINREKRDLQGRIRQRPALDSLPKERIDVAELSKQIQAATEHNQQLSEKQRQQQALEQASLRQENEIERLTKQLDAGREELQKIANDHRQLTEELEKTAPVDISDITAQMEQAQEVNRQFDQRDEVLELIQERKDKEAQEKDMTKRLKQIDRKKAEMAAKADWPIEGLGFGKDGIVLNGVPFAQLASSEQLNCAVAIALHKNPQFRVAIIRDGSLLDEQSMMELTEIVASHNGQCLIERVGTEQCHIVFENGRGTVKQDDD